VNVQSALTSALNLQVQSGKAFQPKTEYQNLVLLIRKSLKGSLFPEPEFLSYQVRTNYAGFKLLSGFENEASSGSFRLP
jgi:hypothetical protein